MILLNSFEMPINLLGTRKKTKSSSTYKSAVLEKFLIKFIKSFYK